MAKGPDALTPAQQRRQRTLYTFFHPSELLSITGPQSSFPLAGSRKRKCTLADNVISQGWGEGAVLRIQELSLPDFMAAHLSTNPTGDAAIFLNNVDAVQLIKHQQHSGSNSSSEDAFEDLVTNIYKSDSQAGKNRIRWLYLMLCVYDMFQRKFPGRTRVGCKMKGLIQTEFKTHIAQATSRNERDGAELADLLAKWFLSGQKLNLLCEEFGDGSPIILVDLLKQDL